MAGYRRRRVVTKLRYYLRADEGHAFGLYDMTARVGQIVTVFVAGDPYEVEVWTAKVAPDGSGVDLTFAKGDVDGLALAIGKHPTEPVNVVWPSPERTAAEDARVTWRQWTMVLGLGAALLGFFWLVS